MVRQNNSSIFKFSLSLERTKKEKKTALRDNCNLMASAVIQRAQTTAPAKETWVAQGQGASVD